MSFISQCPVYKNGSKRSSHKFVRSSRPEPCAASLFEYFPCDFKMFCHRQPFVSSIGKSIGHAAQAVTLRLNCPSPLAMEDQP